MRTTLGLNCNIKNWHGLNLELGSLVFKIRVGLWIKIQFKIS